jgi:hypothetical protein
MILRAVGGLCNRLRAILSRPRPLTVIWPLDAAVDFTPFADVFQPLEGVTFRERGIFSEEAFAPAPDAPSGWQDAYRELRLTTSAHDWLHRVGRSCGREFAAIHVRRTDHTPLAQAEATQTSDADFQRFVADLPLAMPVFVATDNLETQTQWISRLGERVRFTTFARASSAVQRGDDRRRHTSLRHAAVDLFVCARATHFMGSTHSSFTDTIEILRSLR